MTNLAPCCARLAGHIREYAPCSSCLQNTTLPHDPSADCIIRFLARRKMSVRLTARTFCLGKTESAKITFSKFNFSFAEKFEETDVFLILWDSCDYNLRNKKSQKNQRQIRLIQSQATGSEFRHTSGGAFEHLSQINP